MKLVEGKDITLSWSTGGGCGAFTGAAQTTSKGPAPKQGDARSVGLYLRDLSCISCPKLTQVCHAAMSTEQFLCTRRMAAMAI